MKTSALPIRLRPSPRNVVLCSLASLLVASCGGDGAGGVNEPPPVIVASVTVTGTSTVEAGRTVQLSATAQDASGNAISGRTFTWQSSNEAVATVSGGLVTAKAPGSAIISATTADKRGEMTVTVSAVPVGSVSISPSFATADVGQATTFTGAVLDASGAPITGATLAWSSLNTAVASVDAATGRVTGVAAGQARVLARSGDRTDTATVAILAAQSVLSTAFVGTTAKTDVRAGQTITVPVTLDLRKVSPNGDLGAVQFELTYDNNILEFLSAAPNVSGSAESHVVEPGKLRFAYVTTNVQNRGDLTLVTLSFRVAAGAALGTQRVLGLSYTARPTSTSFTTYEMPIAVSGKLRVIAP